MTCADCTGRISLDGGEKHVCKDDDTKDPLEGLQRGRDYQKCPGCSVTVQLSEACNHMFCQHGTCRTEFCYICGEPATARSGHWDYGRSCPRWGQQGSQDAIFDREPNAAPRPRGPFLALDLIVRGVDIATAEGPAPPDAPREVRVRRADRRRLRDIAQQTLTQAQPGPNGAADPPVAMGWAMSAHWLASGLMGSIDVYALHLEPDFMARLRRQLDIDIVHPLLQHLAERVGDEGFQQYPQLREIYQTYLQAHEARLQDMANWPEEDGDE